jgi:hypothetical protein
MRTELGRINDDLNVAGRVASCRGRNDTRLIGGGDLHAQ